MKQRKGILEKSYWLWGDSNRIHPVSSRVYYPPSHRPCGACNSLNYILYEDRVSKKVVKITSMYRMTAKLTETV